MEGYGQIAATLTVQRGPGAGRTFTIDAPTITVGRHGQCDLQVNDTWVSRQHARITWGGAGYLIEDLNTVNGTYVNGERISRPRSLRSGDIVRLGTQVELGFQAGAPAGMPQSPPAVIPEPAPVPDRAPAFPEPSPLPHGQPAPSSLPAAVSEPAPPPAVAEVVPSAEDGPAPSPAEAADTRMEEAKKAAGSALTSAIVGLFICGLILEPSAISQARKARKVLEPGDPGYGKAIAAEIIGWLGLVLWIVAIIYQLSNM